MTFTPPGEHRIQATRRRPTDLVGLERLVAHSAEAGDDIRTRGPDGIIVGRTSVELDDGVPMCRRELLYHVTEGEVAMRMRLRNHAPKSAAAEETNC